MFAAQGSKITKKGTYSAADDSSNGEGGEGGKNGPAGASGANIFAEEEGSEELLQELVHVISEQGSYVAGTPIDLEKARILLMAMPGQEHVQEVAKMYWEEMYWEDYHANQGVNDNNGYVDSVGNECCICQEGGDLLVCDGGPGRAGCGRCYHIGCIGLLKTPLGDRICRECAVSFGIGMDNGGIGGYEFVENVGGRGDDENVGGDNQEDHSDEEFEF
jgi:hypothetical protein